MLICYTVGIYSVQAPKYFVYNSIFSCSQVYTNKNIVVLFHQCYIWFYFLLDLNERIASYKSLSPFDT